MSLSRKFRAMRNLVVEALYLTLAWFAIYLIAFAAGWAAHYVETYHNDKTTAQFFYAGKKALIAFDVVAITLAGLWFLAEFACTAWDEFWLSRRHSRDEITNKSSQESSDADPGTH